MWTSFGSFEPTWGASLEDTWYRTGRKASDHHRLRMMVGISSASALLGQSPLIVSSKGWSRIDCMVLALSALPQNFAVLVLQAQGELVGQPALVHQFPSGDMHGIVEFFICYQCFLMQGTCGDPAYHCML
jgi:hypothetical protein